MSPNNEVERIEMSRVSYVSMVGSLVYAMICIRSDIVQAVGVVSGFMAGPSKEHWSVMKRVLRYIKGTWLSKLQTVVALFTTKVE